MNILFDEKHEKPRLSFFGFMKLSLSLLFIVLLAIFAMEAMNDMIEIISK